MLLVGSLCPEVIDSLKTWEPSVSPDEIKYLTHEGEEEMLLLGERFQHRFPKLLPEEYSNKSYNVGQLAVLFLLFGDN